MCLQRARSLSAGCSGSQTTTAGQPMSRSPTALCPGSVHNAVPAPVKDPVLRPSKVAAELACASTFCFSN